MDDLTLTGSWWIPKSENRARGTVFVNSESSYLNLKSELFPYQWESEAEGSRSGHLSSIDVDESALHGLVDNGGPPCTLFGVRGSILSAPFDEVDEYFSVEAALLGQFIESDRFIEAQVEFDLLGKWLLPPSLTPFQSDDTRGVLHVDDGEIELAKVALDYGLTVRVIAIAVYDENSNEEFIGVRRVCRVVITSSVAVKWRALLAKYVEPFRDLLILLLARPVVITKLWLRPKLNEPLLQITFPLRQPARAATQDYSLNDYRQPTLLMGCDSAFPLEAIIRSWPHVYGKYRETLELFRVPFYVPSITGSYAFSSTFQAAEALHGASPKLESFAMKRADHKARVAQIRKALDDAHTPPELADWSAIVLSNANGKSMRVRIEELLHLAGAAGSEILRVTPEFGKEAVKARNDVAHPAGSGGTHDIRRMLLRQGLQWIVRLLLVREMGFEKADEVVAKKSAFIRLISRLEATQELARLN